MSIGSIITYPVAGAGLAGALTPTYFMCYMDLFIWLPILRLQPAYSVISSVVLMNVLALVLGITISYACPFITSSRPLNVVGSLLLLLFVKDPEPQPVPLLLPSWLRQRYPPYPPRPWPPLLAVTSPVNPEIPDAPAVEAPLLDGGVVVAVPNIF